MHLRVMSMEHDFIEKAMKGQPCWKRELGTSPEPCEKRLTRLATLIPTLRPTRYLESSLVGQVILTYLNQNLFSYPSVLL